MATTDIWPESTVSPEGLDSIGVGSAPLNNHLAVDEPEPFDDFGTYVIKTSNGDFPVVAQDVYRLTACGLAADQWIDSVSIIARVINLATGVTKYAKVGWNIGGVDYDAPERAPGAIWTTFDEPYALNPATGLPWTAADLDAARMYIFMDLLGSAGSPATVVVSAVRARITHHTMISAELPTATLRFAAQVQTAAASGIAWPHYSVTVPLHRHPAVPVALDRNPSITAPVQRRPEVNVPLDRNPTVEAPLHRRPTVKVSK